MYGIMEETVTQFCGYTKPSKIFMYVYMLQ